MKVASTRTLSGCRNRQVPEMYFPHDVQRSREQLHFGNGVRDTFMICCVLQFSMPLAMYAPQSFKTATAQSCGCLADQSAASLCQPKINPQVLAQSRKASGSTGNRIAKQLRRKEGRKEGRVGVLKEKKIM
eukprot:1141326-Pelagomonas_calceolata.AAC.2